MSAIASTSAPARVPRAAAFLLLASITVSFLAGSSAPTPLYAIYRSEWHFSATMMTAIFGVYALAVLVALLVAGRLSDHVGRRPVLVAAIAVQVVTMALFAEAGSLAQLILARVLQGLSAGAALGAIGAGLLDIDKSQGAIANSVTPPIGTAAGAVLAGILVQYFAHPTQLVYVVLAAVLVLQGIGVALMAETHTPRPGALASLKPHLRFSPEVRRALVLSAPALVAAWAMAGFFASLGPSLVQTLFGSGTLVGSLSLFVMASSAAVVTWLLRNLPGTALTRLGTIVLAIGTAGILLSFPQHSALLFWVALPVAGAGFGAAFQGGVRTIALHAPAHERAGALSIAFVISYLAMGLPAIVAGYLVTRQGDLVATASEFGVFVIVLAMAALAATLGDARLTRAPQVR
ncbi:MAG TPA: MFS transporter [Usitatibacter sp.]|nr:MFS transporter [Usitatibacter sp.]